MQRAFPSVGPANVKGIELNAYAAELARVSVWIGEIQWMRRNGFSGSRRPILDPLETIESRDAIVTPAGGDPKWPDADAIIGNPPFLGGKLLIANLGEDYVDVIYNGADDNASGTVAVVEVAEAMAAMSTPPARSVVFLLVSGEERGLWGSEWFSENPTVPIKSTVANINADMVGRNWTDTIVAIGKEHSDLGATLESVNDAHPELNMTAIDDLWPEQRFYRRSDHYVPCGMPSVTARSWRGGGSRGPAVPRCPRSRRPPEGLGPE